MDYRGELGVILYNASQFIIPLSKGDRICQLKLSAAPEIEWNIIEELDETGRQGGFGSTGGFTDIRTDNYEEIN